MTLKKLLNVFGLALLMVVFIFNSAQTYANDVKIIVNECVATTSLKKTEIKNIFLGVTTKWPDKQKIYFVVNKEPEVHNIFVRKYLKKSPSQFNACWKRKLFAGKGKIPTMLKTEKDIIEYVEKTKGAIGYVATEALTKNVNVIEIIE